MGIPPASTEHANFIIYQMRMVMEQAASADQCSAMKSADS